MKSIRLVESNIAFAETTVEATIDSTFDLLPESPGA
jgi:hypothetical protein